MSDPIELQTNVAGVVLRVAPLQKSDNLVFSLISEYETLSITVSTPGRISMGTPHDNVMVNSSIFMLNGSEKERLRDWLNPPQAIQQEALA